MTPAAEVLLSTAFALSEPRQWEHGAMSASDADGRPIGPDHRLACRWCLGAALVQANFAVGHDPFTFYEAQAALRQALGTEITWFNDAAKTTHAELMAKLYEAAFIANGREPI